MAELDLEGPRVRAEKATQEPWHGTHDEFGGCASFGDYGWVCGGPNAPEYDVDSAQGHADAEFIAHARSDVPALIAEAERLKAELDDLRYNLAERAFTAPDADDATKFTSLDSRIHESVSAVERVRALIDASATEAGREVRKYWVPVPDLRRALDGEEADDE